MKRVFAITIILLNLGAGMSNAEVLKCKLEPSIGIPGDKIILRTDKGGFGEEQGESFLTFSDQPDQKLTIESWKDDEIVFIVPNRSTHRLIYLNIHIDGEIVNHTELKFGIINISGLDLVEEAISLKEDSNMAESAIIEHLSYLNRPLYLLERGSSKQGDYYFGNYHLTSHQIYKLRKAGFEDDFISKFEGQPQRVTFGLSALWLWKTADLVPAPIIRIFLIPRSYFYEYKPLWSGLFQKERFDLNIGYTPKTNTQKNDLSSEKKSYALIGLSYQINRSALLNFGYALVPKDTTGEEGQLYVGFTLDSNFLKDIGLVNK